MTRRNALTAVAGAPLAVPATASPAKNAILELRWLRMRNGADDQARRTKGFLEHGLLPALERSGVGPVGFFEGLIAPDSPFVLMVTSYPNLATYYEVTQKLMSAEASDAELERARAEYYHAPGLGYVRMEVSLLRAFDAMPNIETPSIEGRDMPRIFELRTYESDNFHTLRRKIKMFHDDEIAIFRRVGIPPVFFAESIVGKNLPNLTYMVTYDSLAAREKAWAAFGADARWKELRAKPELSDAEIVSNVSNAILRPLPFSAIR